MDRNYKKGFTLIELLVVIAIIGILSAVVLASLNAARQRGTDAAIKSNLNNARSQAELHHSTRTPAQGYSSVCSVPATAVPHAIGNLVNAAALAGGHAGWGTGAGANTTSSTARGCNDSVTGWVAWTQLRDPAVANGVWCVDSTGFSNERGPVAANVTRCN